MAAGRRRWIEACFDDAEIDTPQAVAAYRASHPDDPAMTDLARWHRFEQDRPDLFIAMYQFWCQKI